MREYAHIIDQMISWRGGYTNMKETGKTKAGIRLLLIAVMTLLMSTVTVFAAEYNVDGLMKDYRDCDNPLLTSAVFHDIETAYQGGENYAVYRLWDTTGDNTATGIEGTSISFASGNTYRMTLDKDDADIVVWAYEKKNYTSKSGSSIEYYERVSLAKGPVWEVRNAAGGVGKELVITNVKDDQPIAVMLDGEHGYLTGEFGDVILKEAYTDGSGTKHEAVKKRIDPFWHYYYTDSYAKAHNDFLLEFYNYKKTTKNIGGQDVNVLELTGLHEAWEGYATMSMSLAGVGLAKDVVLDPRYGNDIIPEGLKGDGSSGVNSVNDNDFIIKDWKVPAQWTDPYDGKVYQVAFGENFDAVPGEGSFQEAGNWGNVVYRPVFPISAQNVEVDATVIFPENCAGLFYMPNGFAFTSQSKVRGLVGGQSGPLSPGRESDYKALSTGFTESFRLTGEKGSMADNVKNMTHMFRFTAKELRDFDITPINTKNVTDMSNMFDLMLSGYMNPGGDDCCIRGLSSVTTDNVTDMSEMFTVWATGSGPSGFRMSLTKDDLAGFNTAKVTDMSLMFEGSDFVSLDLSGFDFSNVTTMKDMFYRNPSLESIILPENINTANVTDMSGLFRGCMSLSEIRNVDKLNTASVTDMSYMFGRYYYRAGKPYAATDYNGPIVNAINISGYRTGNVTNMTGMFDLPEVTSLDVSLLDTSNVTKMTNMFRLPKVTSLDVSTFNTSKVTQMGGMFDLASAKELKLGNYFDASKAVDVSSMFKLSAVEFMAASLDVSSATNMYNMFDLKNCKSLIVALKGGSGHSFTINGPGLLTLDLSQVTAPGSVFGIDTFANCTSLMDLYLPETLPTGWYQIPKLPVKFYLVGQTPYAEYETFETLVGDLSAYASMSAEGTAAIGDEHSERPVVPVKDAILLRPAEVSRVTAASIGANGKYDEQQGKTVYDDVSEITIYSYNTKYELEDYPTFANLTALTTPEKPYPTPVYTWEIKDEKRDEATSPVLELAVSDYSDAEAVITAGSGTGTATVTLTVQDPEAAGTDQNTYTASIKVTVLPMLRPSHISFAEPSVSMKAGKTLDNAVVFYDSDGKEMSNVTIGGATYSSNAPDVVSVDEKTGKLAAKKVGTAMITAVSNDPAGLKATCIIIVMESDKPAEHTHTADATKWLSDATNHWHVCKGGDGQVMDKAAHTFDAGKVTKEATTAAEGEMTYTCTVCGYTKKTAIAKKEETKQEAKVGDKVEAKDGTAEYKVTGTTKDASGKEVPTLAYTEPEGAAETAKKVEIPATVDLGDGTKAVVTEIAEGAFEKNTRITTVVIGKNVKTIRKNAFKGCKKITTVTAKGDALETIGDGAFQNCSKLKSVTFGKNVKKIGKNAFNGDGKLKKLRFKGLIKKAKIGKNAFKNIRKDATVYIPKKLSKKQQTTFKKSLISKGGMPKTVKFKLK